MFWEWPGADAGGGALMPELCTPGNERLASEQTFTRNLIAPQARSPGAKRTKTCSRSQCKAHCASSTRVLSTVMWRPADWASPGTRAPAHGLQSHLLVQIPFCKLRRILQTLLTFFSLEVVQDAVDSYIVPWIDIAGQDFCCRRCCCRQQCSAHSRTLKHPPPAAAAPSCSP